MGCSVLLLAVGAALDHVVAATARRDIVNGGKVSEARNVVIGAIEIYLGFIIPMIVWAFDARESWGVVEMIACFFGKQMLCSARIVQMRIRDCFAALAMTKWGRIACILSCSYE